jgi:hypothetical protein
VNGLFPLIELPPFRPDGSFVWIGSVDSLQTARVDRVKQRTCCSTTNRQTPPDVIRNTVKSTLEVMVLGKNKERWEELCELAAKEQDPEKLKELTDEINRLLEIKLNRLKRVPPSKG